VEINAVVLNWKGRPATLNFLSDITKRKRMEEDISKIQKLESIGILAGGIAHDFNNILTAILGNVSLAKIYDLQSNVQERLTEAEKACMQAKELTQQLLTFSRGGAPVKKVTSIAHLLSDSAIFASSGSNARCECSIPDDLWAAEVDEGQISQVVNNLVINAEQAMPGGGVIKVSAENIFLSESVLPLEDGNYVKISVEDQGVGIPEQHLQRIFDPYFTTKQKGSGLGLATSYSIIRNHDGHIVVESILGVGTTFHIYLPASSEEAVTREKMEEEIPVMGKGNILVMDDEEFIRELVGDMLVNIGYEATTVSDGAEAVELYKEAKESGRPFDAVIMDLTVPGGMGGREALRRIMEIDPEIKAIVSSGYSNDPIMADFGKYGFSGVIAKPYKTGELSEVLYKVMMGSRQMSVAQTSD
jgi:two-component system cell cycle sensor histidine kinase/response regulator CckA